MAEDTNTGGRSRSKVGRLIESYDLAGDVGAELEAKWLGENTDRVSLRDLADQFNHRLLAAAMDEAGMNTIDGEIENVYRLLSVEDVAPDARIDVRRRLERNGIDVDRLETDFVTYQAIRSYLNDVRGVEYSGPDDADRIERTTESLERLQSRLETVSQNNLAQLRDSDRITLSEFRIFVNADVYCEVCNSQYSVVELLQRGGCDCEGE
jgi:NADH:ubiquinone oxidoreductase subunit C